MSIAKQAIPRPEYPRPQLVRSDWMNLNGTWQFEIDNGMEGFDREYYKRDNFTQQITVPFCPESDLSGVGHKGFMACVWYKRSVTLPDGWAGKRVLLHFGAVDYHTTVWINGQKAGEHCGGYSSFYFDITALLQAGENSIVVAAKDDVRSGAQPGGKQSELYYSHACSYTRTTGIWQTVWLEAVNKKYITNIKATPDAENSSVLLEVKTSADTIGCCVKAEVSFAGKKVGEAAGTVGSFSVCLPIHLSETHLWDVGQGNLYDVAVTLVDGGVTVDTAESYFGLRSVGLKDGAFLLNGRAVFGRWVLDQGFYPDGIYTAPTDEALKCDIELSMSFGFNGARLHEKIFEPRFLYWADKLGYLVWGEHANWCLNIANGDGIKNFLPEWLEAVERDYSHPSIIGWCPFNETWDDHRRGNVRQDNLVLETVYRATKAVDSTRPVIDTSGNYHVVTDIYDIHDYEQDGAIYQERYADGKLYETFPDRQTYRGEPYFVSEYGGIKWPEDESAGWGYGNAPKTREEFFARYQALTEALLQNENMLGFCYTQLYDVEQEVNGLLTYGRKYKFDPKMIYDINTQEAAIEKKINKK